MEPEQNSNGALVGSIIIVIILIAGGIYFWKTSVEERSAGPAIETNDANAPEDGTSVDTGAELEADLNSIDLESLDAEI